jgi:hypothetical protein
LVVPLLRIAGQLKHVEDFRLDRITRVASPLRELDEPLGHPAANEPRARVVPEVHANSTSAIICIEMRPHQTAEISEMSQKVLAPQQQAAKLLFELAHGTRQIRLGDIAGFGRTAEVQGLAEREEIADQVHLRTERSSTVSGKRDNRRTSL